jgi:uncharacterized protein YaeQ
MALGATLYQLHVALSDVERGVYQSLELRVARHPSETLRYMLMRALAYCLCYEEGIAFSKGGLSSTDEPPISVTDATGVMRHFIDIGSPSTDRLHKASKATDRVSLFTYASLSNLQKEVASRNVHRVSEIEVWQLDPSFLDALEPHIERKTKLELVRNEGQLYVTVDGKVYETALNRVSLTPDDNAR